MLSGEATGTPKSGDDLAEIIRVLRLQRQTAVKARTQAINTMRAVLVTAPVDLRDQLHRIPKNKLIAAAARLRPSNDRDVLAAAKSVLRELARRCQHLDAEIGDLDATLDELVPVAAPELVALFGFGTDTAGQSSSPPATTPTASNPKPPSRCCAVPRLDRPDRARQTAGIASTAAVTARPTPLSTESRLSECAGTNRHVPTSNGAPNEGMFEARDHPLPQAIHRTRGLHRTHASRQQNIQNAA